MAIFYCIRRNYDNHTISYNIKSHYTIKLLYTGSACSSQETVTSLLFLSSVSEVGSSTLLYLESAQYSDNGQYICTATLTKANSSEVKTISTSFYVNIQGLLLILVISYTFSIIILENTYKFYICSTYIIVMTVKERCNNC